MAHVNAEKQVDTVDTHQRESDINRLHPVRFNFKEKSKLENAIRVLNTFDNNPITVFSYSDRFLFVKYKDGKNFTISLDHMEVLFRFEASVNMRIAILTINSNEFQIFEDRDDEMTEKEWDIIFNILQCAKITHQREILTKENREKAIHDYQVAKAMARTRRNIQRMNRF